MYLYYAVHPHLSDVLLSKFKVSAKRKRVPLMLCETLDAGLLREAAERKQDEKILVHIRGRDCVALEVRYHKICYSRYTNFLNHKSPSEEHESPGQKYETGYRKFCEEIIEKELIANKQIRYMTDLFNEFLRFVQIAEGVDATSFRASRLKHRLCTAYPQLVFHRPNVRTKSEMVYVENLSSSELVDEHMTLKTLYNEELDCNYSNNSESVHTDEIHVLYNAAMILRNIIQSTPGQTTPWPPLASDLTMENAKQIVPSQLFNFLAWMTGSSNDACLDEHIDVDKPRHTKLMSISQDIVHVTSDGRKLTPKSVSLAMALRQLTGKLCNIIFNSRVIAEDPSTFPVDE